MDLFFCSNTSTQNVIINGFIPKLSPLHDYHILNFKTKNNPKNNNRIKLLEDELNFESVPSFAKLELTNLCKEFNDIFHLKDDILTYNNFYRQNINLADPSPVYIKNYRTPQVEREEVCRQIENLLQNDIVEPSISEYNSPILLVPKKSNNEKKWRLVVDYRQLNKRLLADKFPLPRIDDILDRQSKIFLYT